MLVFDFAKVYSLDEMWVWNYNCPDDYRALGWSGGTASGMRDVTIEYSETAQARRLPFPPGQGNRYPVDAGNESG
ncbi:MAG: hypothetical protein ACYSOH_04400 [Planctomycetota bacterium]